MKTNICHQALQVLIIHGSSLPEGKDSLFRWPSDDKLKSDGPGSEKQGDQLERTAKISKDIMENQRVSLYFFNFNNFHAELSVTFHSNSYKLQR